MSDVLSTDDVRDIWVDYHLNPLSRDVGIALVPAYQAAFDAWLETIRADERERMKRELWPMIGAAEADVRADLRAKIEAMAGVHDIWLYRDDVLALLDGAE